MKLLAKSFEARAAPPRAWAEDLLPRVAERIDDTAASGASGPTTVKWIFSFLEKATNSSIPVSGTFSTPFSVCGAAVARRDKYFLHARALRELPRECMLAPPEPMTSSFISVPEVTHAGEKHGDAALVGRGDHFGVAHAAAGLDHRRSARVGKASRPSRKGKNASEATTAPFRSSFASLP